MPKIKVLDDEVINKIAAGEVIERPASVVKELVENSIDAGATLITVEIEEGGKSSIKVIDNGCGMEKEDALLCLERHATSKISTADDLFKIRTMGFRGEALSSIAAVSELSLKTKTKKAPVGFKILASGGKILDTLETAIPDGSSVEVSNLFFNVPARKKHMRTIQTELRLIVETMTKFSFAHPEKTFKLQHYDQEIMFVPAAKNLLERVLTIYGKRVGYGIIPVAYAMNDIIVKGFLSKPTLTRQDKTIQHIFVNTRAVKNQIITKAVYGAYHTLLHLKNHPLFILHVEIKPEHIDVNVHPQKALIRVEKENELYTAVFSAVRQSLDTAQIIPEITEEKQTTTQAAMIAKEFTVKVEKQAFFHQQELAEKAMQKVTTEAVEVQGNRKISTMKLIGSIHNLFYLAENELGLMIIDQHAAHERVLYERFMQQYYEGTLQIQELLVPEEIEFSPAEMLLFKEYRGSIEHLGFVLEEFGRNTVLLRSVPSILRKLVSRETIHEILAQITDSTTADNGIKEERIIRTACRAAVKANDIVHINEMCIIIEQLQKCKQPFTCPHGRPTMIQFTIPELEKKFKRVV